MTIAKFLTSLKKAEKLLKQTGLLRQKGIQSVNDKGVSDEFKTASQKADYFLAYKTAVRNFDYDFLLADESFFQFEYKSNPVIGVPDVRYSFFQNPQEYKTYDEYINYLKETDLIENDLDISEIGQVFQEEYEQFLAEQSLNFKSITVRFDSDVANYKPLIHSVAHIHIGHSNSIRIPCNKILMPESFVVFVLKHSYYRFWKDLVENVDANLMACLNLSKDECDSLSLQHWQDLEKKELFLS